MLAKAGRRTGPHSPVAETMGPRALARAPRLLRIPMTRPFWLAEPAQGGSRYSVCRFCLGQGQCARQGTVGAHRASVFRRYFPHAPPPPFISHSLPQAAYFPTTKTNMAASLEKHQGFSRALVHGQLLLHSPHSQKKPLYIVHQITEEAQVDNKYRSMDAS